ncbi:MAG: DUF2849 domain-containing protein [Hyphomicrobiaceae bacterium]|nr:DUF2849 domain-containing protein [Hyphomicrobiaceae bacterium]
MPSVITANLLRSGAVAYLAADGRWVSTLCDAVVADDAVSFNTLKAAAQAAVESSEITAVYAFDVHVVDHVPQPISVREAIRAATATAA